jgi:hypothetical protein
MDIETCPPPCQTNAECPICMTCSPALGVCEGECAP